MHSGTCVLRPATPFSNYSSLLKYSVLGTGAVHVLKYIVILITYKILSLFMNQPERNKILQCNVSQAVVCDRCQSVA
jgi:hypothetical protein